MPARAQGALRRGMAGVCAWLVWCGWRLPVGDSTMGRTSPCGSLTHVTFTRQDALDNYTLNPRGGVEAELTGSLRGGATTTAGNEVQGRCSHFLCISTSARNCPREEGSLSCLRLTQGVTPTSTTRLYRGYVKWG
jgi:hypothetical protein